MVRWSSMVARITSLIDSTPVNRPPSTTGRWRMCIPAIVSNLPTEAVLGDGRAQARDISLRVNAADVSGLGHSVGENTPVTLTSTLAGVAGAYRIASVTQVPNTQHVFYQLKKVS